MQSASNDKQTYKVRGYDKDADIYETICESELYERATEIARAVMRYHANMHELRRTKTNEPFDWFVVSDDNDNPLRIFTFEFPDGHDPNIK